MYKVSDSKRLARFKDFLCFRQSKYVSYGLQYASLYDGVRETLNNMGKDCGYLGFGSIEEICDCLTYEFNVKDSDFYSERVKLSLLNSLYKKLVDFNGKYTEGSVFDYIETYEVLSDNRLMAKGRDNVSGSFDFCRLSVGNKAFEVKEYSDEGGFVFSLDYGETNIFETDTERKGITDFLVKVSDYERVTKVYERNLEDYKSICDSGSDWIELRALGLNWVALSVSSKVKVMNIVFGTGLRSEIFVPFKFILSDKFTFDNYFTANQIV